MPPFRFSFWLRFCVSFCFLAGVALCVYTAAAVLFFTPAPQPPAYDIAPLQTQKQAEILAEREKLTAEQRQTAKKAAAAAAAAQEALAKAGNIEESNAVFPFFAKANSERGRRIFSRCAACHSNNKNGGNRIGPNLWGINGRAAASVNGFFYSAAMKAFAQKQPHWNLASLDRFLAAPAADIPGTIMFYRGVKDLQERADLLLYLESLKE